MASQKEEIKQTRRRRLNWIIAILLVVATTALCLPTFNYYQTSDLQVGKPSPRTYQLDQRYRIKDNERTQKLKSEAKAEITPQFVFDKTIIEGVLNNLRSEIKKLRNENSDELKGITVPDSAEKWDRFEKVSTQIAEYMLDRGMIKDKEILDELKKHNKASLMINNKGVDATLGQRQVTIRNLADSLIDYDRLEEHTRQIISSLYPDYKYANLVNTLVSESLRPTVSFNKKQYERKIQEVNKQIEPYYLTFEKNEILLEMGEKVTEEKISTLRKINRERWHYQLTNGGASFGLIMIALIFLYVYMDEFEEELFEEHNKLALLAVLSVLFVGLAKVIELLQANLPPMIEYAYPIAAAVMLVTLMISEGVAFLFTIFLALIVVSFYSMKVELIAMLILGGFAGIFSIRKVERRVTLLRSGIVIGIVQSLVVFCLLMLRTADPFSTETGTLIAWGMINGAIIVPFTVLGLLPFLENGFDITTNFRLLELADLNHPLLRELFQKAPGSFQHSVMLSNLCEQTARDIGANAMLVRVGCLYHDLGKAENPEYFIENQEGIENPHDELKPTLSASILKAHVKNGSQVAREAGLPPEIIDLIEQHHGTTTMKPFYHEALKSSDGDVNEEEFQYPGPLPQTKEAGLCMLGDAVEAACRALEDPTPQKIKERISNIVREKFSEGQLNECDLTLRDLNTIIDTFTRILTSVYHRRIEYPEAENPEEMEKPVEKLQTGGTSIE